MTAAVQLPRLQARPGLRERSVLSSGNLGVGELVGPLTAAERPGGLARRAAPALPVAAALTPVLPEGIRRGSTITVSGSVSLLLALLGAPSAAGAWGALVGMPPISAEAAAEYGVDLARLAFIPDPGAEWSTAVGALLDAVDLVVLRPPATVADGTVRRLAARTRSKDAVLLPYLTGTLRWPGADVALSTTTIEWIGIDDARGPAVTEPAGAGSAAGSARRRSGHGRLLGRQVTISASGRGRNAAPRTTQCWLPAPVSGGITAAHTETTTLTPLSRVS
ncbi:MAG: hypothetical protein ACR2KJ_08705 [Jatrophihabitans sp.]